VQSAAEPRLRDTRELRQAIKSWSHVRVLASAYHTAEVWLVIAATVYISTVVVPLSSGILGVFVYLLAVVVVSSRQHALMVLTHEGIHKRLSRTLWLNDWLARLTMAFPVFISLAKWRFIHLYHHQYTHTGDDPDRAIYARYPLGSKKFLRLLLRDVSGLNVIATLKYFVDIPLVTSEFNRRFLGAGRAAQYRQVADMCAFFLFWAVTLGSGFYWGGRSAALLFVLYWLVPYCTVTQVFFRIRGAIEHGNVPDPGNPYQQTRTYFMSPVLGFFLSPKSVNYHLEHHLYPSVPFYHLPRLHQALQQQVYLQESGYCEPFIVALRKLIS